jgi:hypothetical protein
VVHSGLPGGPWWSAGRFGRQIIAKIVVETEQMKNTPMHVCAKAAYVG